MYGIVAPTNMADLARNKKATFNYEILETFEAGLVLFGYEVKATRVGRATLDGAYITITNGEAWLKGATISYYQEANTPASYQPTRERKLLLNKKEIHKLEKELNTAGLTVVPLKLYSNAQKVKLSIALVRGKKQADKRQSIKARDTKRDLDRLLKQ